MSVCFSGSLLSASIHCIHCIISIAKKINFDGLIDHDHMRSVHGKGTEDGISLVAWTASRPVHVCHVHHHRRLTPNHRQVLLRRITIKSNWQRGPRHGNRLL